MAKEHGREMYGAHTDLPITSEGITNSFALYRKLCSNGTLTLESAIARKQVHALLENGILLNDKSCDKNHTLAEIILEQVEGYEWLTKKQFPEGVLRKYGWSRELIEKIAIGLGDYRVRNDSELDDYEIYRRSIKNHPIYSEESQIALGWKVKSGDIEARNKLVVSNLRFVASVAVDFHRKYPSMPIMQFVEWGNEICLDSTSTYDPSKGVSFTSYLHAILKRELHEQRNAFKRNMKFPSKTFYKVTQLRRQINIFTAEKGREPTVDELVHSMDWEESLVRRIYSVHRLDKMPLELSYNYSVSRPSRAAERYEKKELHEQVDKMLFYIGVNERRVLRLLYGIDCEPHTMREAAKKIGLCYERVNQLHQEAIKKIRANPRATRKVEAFLNKVSSA